VGERGDDEQEGGAPPAGAEFQFLAADEAAAAGDTQALAPATQEQAAQQAAELDAAASEARERQRQQEQVGRGVDRGGRLRVPAFKVAAVAVAQGPGLAVWRSALRGARRCACAAAGRCGWAHGHGGGRAGGRRGWAG
jgi:hypothetical protein